MCEIIDEIRNIEDDKEMARIWKDMFDNFARQWEIYYSCIRKM